MGFFFKMFKGFPYWWLHSFHSQDQWMRLLSHIVASTSCPCLDGCHIDVIVMESQCSVFSSLLAKDPPLSSPWDFHSVLASSTEYTQIQDKALLCSRGETPALLPPQLKHPWILAVKRSLISHYLVLFSLCIFLLPFKILF